MELDEAIIHARQVADGCGVDSQDCAYQHYKLVDWLEELKAYRSKIPPSRMDEAAMLLQAREDTVHTLHKAGQKTHLFRRYQDSLPGGDCTAFYAVVLDRACTLQEFINDMLEQYPTEWGNINIQPEIPGKLSIGAGYRDGVLDIEYPTSLAGRPVVSVIASGGYSRMDYYIKIQGGGHGES